MNKKLLIISTFSLSLLSGCQSLNSSDNPLVSNEDSMCDKLKRQMIYNRRDTNQNMAYTSPRERERMQQLYEEYDCEND